jgi:hypothetical protein
VPTARFQGGWFDALGRRYATPRVLMPYGNSAKASLNGWGRRPTSAPRQAEPPLQTGIYLSHRKSGFYPAISGRRPCCSRQRLGPLPTATRQRRMMVRKNGVLNVRISIGACRLIQEHAPLRPPDKNRAAEQYTVPGPRDSFTFWRRQRLLAFLFSAGSH